MNVEARIESLTGKHAALEEHLRQVEASGLPQDPSTIRQMKARKLHLKDEITSLRRTGH